MKPCTDCGIQYNPWVMQFDHRKPEDKIDDISKGLSWGIKKLLAEIRKCDVVCANCHAERSYQNRYKWPNGTRPRGTPVEGTDGQIPLFVEEL